MNLFISSSRRRYRTSTKCCIVGNKSLKMIAPAEYAGWLSVTIAGLYLQYEVEQYRWSTSFSRNKKVFLFKCIIQTPMLLTLGLNNNNLFKFQQFVISNLLPNMQKIFCLQQILFTEKLEPVLDLVMICFILDSHNKSVFYQM